MSKLNLDFDIVNQSNCKYLSIIDVSTYIDKPTNTVLDITIPGYQIPVRVYFDIEKINVYNSGLLGLSSGSSLATLPDGVYTITYRICPIDELFITKKIIRTCEIECKYINLFARLTADCDVCQDAYKKLEKLRNYIESAKANASICNYLKATEFLQKANSLVLDIDCNC